jgi:hypothetical protein
MRHSALTIAFLPALLAWPRAVPGDRSYTLTVTTATLLQTVRQLAFTDSGRAYPCRHNPACSSWGDALAASRPGITVDGPRVVLSIHVTGTYVVNEFIAPQVDGDLTASAIPVVERGLVHLTASQVAAGPNGDVTFRAFVGAFHTQLEEMLNQRAAFDLASYLAAASRNPALPPPRIPDLSCLDPAQIAVRQVGTQPSPAGLTAAVTVHTVGGAPRQPPGC